MAKIINQAVKDALETYLRENPAATASTLLERLQKERVLGAMALNEGTVSSQATAARKRLGIPSMKGKVGAVKPPLPAPDAEAVKPPPRDGRRRAKRAAPAEPGEPAESAYDVHFCPHCGFDLKTLRQLLRIAQQRGRKV